MTRRSDSTPDPKPETRNSGTVLGLFARAPRLGEVKTRLAAEIGPAAALAAYRDMLVRSLARFADVAERRVVVFTPADADDEFAALAPQWERLAQCEGELGARLRAFFAGAFAAGADRVVCLGVDSPSLPADFIRHALNGLSRDDVALGPTQDGGYYLVGLSRFTDAPFDRIDWGGPRVFEQTMRRCRDAGLSITRSPEWYDVDTAADLRRLRSQP